MSGYMQEALKKLPVEQPKKKPGNVATPEQKAIICLAIRDWRIKKRAQERMEAEAKKKGGGDE